MLKLFSVTLVLSALAVYFALLRAAPSAELSYVTMPVEHGPLTETITATGTVDVMVKVDVGSQVSGRIEEVRADFNTAVKKGAPLAVIDRQGFEARVEEARAAVEIALAAVEVQAAVLEKAAVGIVTAQLDRGVYRAKVDQAEASLSVVQSRLRRKEALGKNGTVSAADLEEDRGAVLTARAQLREAEALYAASEQHIASAQADFARAQAELAGARANVPQKQAALQLAQVELERTTIRSPIDGVVIDRSIDEGQTVAAALEAPKLFTIAGELRRMVVHVNVDETDIGRIRPGQQAVFTVDAFPAERFPGTVSEIRKSAKVFQNIVTYTVVLNTENPEELLFPGMTALVDILVKHTGPALKIPTSTLSYRPSAASRAGVPEGAAVVWRLSPAGQPEAVEVTTGDHDASHTAVSPGALRQGDQLISGEIEVSDSRRFWQIFLKQ